MLVDTHAHINLHAFKDDADEVLQRAFANDVTVINVGTEYPSSKQAVEMLAQYPERVYAVVGLHPSHTYDNPYLDENESAHVVGKQDFAVDAFRQLAQHERVVGIGECGLDYYRLPEESDAQLAIIKAQQKEVFERQIKLAQELDKALVIHCRPSKDSTDAYDDVLEILASALSSSRMRGSSSSTREPLSNFSVVGWEADVDSRLRGNDKFLRFEVHSFTGSLAVATKFIELGAYIGLNGIITFDKTGNMEAVVKGVPLERIVLETDSPYLAPVPNRGKRNEPLHVRSVAEKIAEWKGASVEAVEHQTTKNAHALFNLPL